MSGVNEWLDRRRWVVDGGRKVLLPKANDDRKLLVAVENVLELHEPIGGFEGDPSYWECNVCGDDRGPKPYPCPTVRAIEGAINDH